MSRITSKNAARQDFLPLLRELVRAYQAFAACDAAGYRASGSDLTVPQADVLFTLGNTDGLSCGELGEKTLITKGTLTGILDRMEDKGLLRRVPCPEDGRRYRISLTAKGQQQFEREFPRQIAYLKERFDRLSAQEKTDTLGALTRLRQLF